MVNALRSMVATVSLLVFTGAGLHFADAAERVKLAREVQVTVTSNGFEPAEIKAKKGEPLRLIITRKTDKTCATEVVIKELDIQRKLPLNEPVTVELTPQKDGQLRYACGMGMVAGVIFVE